MVNGPLGGNMGTPPVPPQPPQVSFETTAQSRGNFNNFLKSMPNTTAMTPLPPMGSPSMMPAPNPMGNIDIFNEPTGMQFGGVAGNPLSGYGDYLSQQIDNTQVEPFIQEVEQMANDRFNLGGSSGGLPQIGDGRPEPINNRLPQLGIFNPPQQQDMMARPPSLFQRPAAPFQMQGLGQPMRDKDGILRPSIPFEPALRGGAEMFGNIGSLPRTYFNGGEVDDSDFGGFSDYGSVDATSDDGFSEDNDVSDYSTDDSGVYTGGDDNNQDIALPTPRPEILQEAIGRAENQVFGDTEGDALGFFNKAGGLTEAGQKEFDSAIMANLDVLQDDRPADTGIQLANIGNIFDGVKSGSTPENLVQASFRPGSLNPTFGGNVLDGLDLNTAFGENRARNVEPIGAQGSGSRGEIVTSTLEEYPGDAFPGKALTTQNVSPQNTADRIARNNKSINEIRAGIESGNDDIYTDSVPNLYDPPEEDPNYNPNVPSLAYQGYNPNLDEGYNPNVPSTLDVNSPRGFTPLDIDTRPENALGFRQNFEDFVFDPKNYDMDAISTNVVPGIEGLTPDEKSKLEEFSPIVAAGIEAPKEFRDPFKNAGIGAIPTLTSLANKFSAYSRGRVLDSIAQKGYTPVMDGDVIVGAKNKFGQLMEGMDPNAPMGSDDNNENPFILKPKAKEEEKEEEDKPPNVIGGGDIPAPPAPKSVVVDSPFTSNVGDFVPASFNTGELNKLIEALTGISAPKSMKQGGVAGYAEGGRVMQALDNLLATG